jgi:hypothetical protein
MTSKSHHLSQVNISRMVAPLSSPIMADFVAELDSINKLADSAPGFVWRLQTEAGNATSISAYDDELVLFNLSVWESINDLKQFVYRSQHEKVMRDRQKWFRKSEGTNMALWWVHSGDIPTVDEAKKRLQHLNDYGESEYAFSFKNQLFTKEAISVN